MSVSTLTEIEACPRRWALSSAEYRDIWGGHGYPPRINVNTLGGNVTHLVLETVTKHLVGAGCPSVEDPKAVLVLKELGGYTKIVQDCIDRVLERFAANPRAFPLLEDSARTLYRQAPELRMRAQRLLARVRLAQLALSSNTSAVGTKWRGPLTAGAFPEVELHARQIGWKGRADLVVLSDEDCEITDFKTGMRDEAHKFQLQVYALLWSLDQDRNPNGRLASKLILAYNDGNLDVPAPTATQLAELKRELVRRGDAARAAVQSGHPPQARPSAENCRFCSVRHLCNEYWVPDPQRPSAFDANPRFSDAELKIVGRHGPSSWDAVIVPSRTLASGKAALLRTPQDTQLRPGQHLRVLDAAIAVDSEEQDNPAIITVGTFSEIYAVA
jgi:hypothetical protein